MILIRRRPRVAAYKAAFLALILSLTACQSRDDDTAPAAGAVASSARSDVMPDACELLTAEDARTALGVDAKRTDPANLGGTSMCQYMASNSESVTLQVHPGAPRDFDDYVKQSVEAFNATAEPVAGVGERAMLVGDQFLFSSKGRMYIILLGKNLPTAEKAERTRQLAAAVLSRI